MKLPAPFVRAWRDVQLNFDAVIKGVTKIEKDVTTLQTATASEVRGQDTATGTGVSFADRTITDNLGTTAKFGGGWERVGVGGTFTADACIVRIVSTTTNTTTLRVLTRLGGNITVGQTVVFDFRVWK